MKFLPVKKLRKNWFIQSFISWCMTRLKGINVPCDDHPREECGVFGIYGCKNAANFVYLGLYSLQHRGQESAGIVSTNGSRFFRHAGMGRVRRIFDQKKIQELIGRAAIGHNRYSTTGASHLRNAQPICVESHMGFFALAHNGNLINGAALRTKLKKEGAIFQTTMDTEIIVHLFSRTQAQDSKQFIQNLAEALKQVQGAYSLILLTKTSLFAVRDPNGFRPLVLGKRANGSYVVASETCAFDITDTTFVRDVACGELIEINEKGIQSYFPFRKTKESMCIFEQIYFARPDSFIFSRSVYQTRIKLGRELAKVQSVPADMVVPIPDSSNCAALGYSLESKIPLNLALIRSHYIGRTFIEPMQRIRDFGTKLKYNVVASVVEGKRVILIDDSIMRGTTARKLTRMIRKAGATEIHMRISAPPTRFPCYYGVDIPTSQELIASNKELEEIQSYFGVDSLAYLPLAALFKAVRVETDDYPHQGWCDACFTGNYPIQNQESKQEKLFQQSLYEEVN